MSTLEQLEAAALELTREDRARLAARLEESLLSEDERAIREEWIDVAERRLDEIRSGAVMLVSDEEAIAAARRAVADVRSPSSRS